MQRISSYTPIRQNKTVSFGNYPAGGVGDSAYTKEQRKAKQLEEIAKLASDSKPSAIKSFTIVSALMCASALTGSAVSGRFFNVLNGLGAFKKLTPKVALGLEKLQTKLQDINPENLSNFKKTTINAMKSGVEYLEKTSRYGVEEQIAKVNAKKAKRIQTLGQTIKKKNPDIKFTKEELKAKVNQHIAENQDQQKYFDERINEIRDIKGTNLSKKITKASAATVMGIGALKEASKDCDNNGVPDCVEYSKASKETTQKLTAALLDCALDSI